MAFLYGLAMPMMFPICLIAFVILYICEKFMVTYFYRKPPQFDNSLNTGAINAMKYAPLFFMAFGYWVMGNRQIFETRVKAKTYMSDPVTTGHTVQLAWDQTLPPLIAFFVIFFGLIFRTQVHELFQKMGMVSKEP